MADMAKLRMGNELMQNGLTCLGENCVIINVTSVEQAVLAEEAGAGAVSVSDMFSADIRAGAGVARMAEMDTVLGITDAVSIPVIGMVRIGHVTEAEMMQAAGVNMIDESEMLSVADAVYHIDKSKFDTPFMCGAQDLGEALRRIAEGAAMIRVKGEPGTGDVVEAVRQLNTIMGEVRSLRGKDKDELLRYARQIEAPQDLLIETAILQRLPVITFASGGIATPADAALMMNLGADGIFVGSGIFRSKNPAKTAKAMVDAVRYYDDPEMLVKISAGIGGSMRGQPLIPVGSTESDDETV